MFPDGLPFCTVHIPLTSLDSHRREYRDGNNTDLHTGLHMVGVGGGDDDRAAGLLQSKQAGHNRQRTVYALIAEMSQAPRASRTYGGLNRIPIQNTGFSSSPPAVRS